MFTTAYNQLSISTNCLLINREAVALPKPTRDTRTSYSRDMRSFYAPALHTFYAPSIGFTINITSSTPRRDPQFIVLTVDVSGSMAYVGSTRLAWIKESFKIFMDKYDTLLQEGDMLSVVTFDEFARVVILPTLVNADTVEAIKRTFEGIQANGATSISNGFKKAIDVIELYNLNKLHSVIAVVTDGEDSSLLDDLEVDAYIPFVHRHQKVVGNNGTVHYVCIGDADKKLATLLAGLFPKFQMDAIPDVTDKEHSAEILACILSNVNNEVCMYPISMKATATPKAEGLEKRSAPDEPAFKLVAENGCGVKMGFPSQLCFNFLKGTLATCAMDVKVELMYKDQVLHTFDLTVDAPTGVESVNPDAINFAALRIVSEITEEINKNPTARTSSIDMIEAGINRLRVLSDTTGEPNSTEEHINSLQSLLARVIVGEGASAALELSNNARSGSTADVVSARTASRTDTGRALSGVQSQNPVSSEPSQNPVAPDSVEEPMDVLD